MNNKMQPNVNDRPEQAKPEKVDTVIAVFADHNAAEAAVKKLTAAGFAMKSSQCCRQGISNRRKGRRLLQRG